MRKIFALSVFAVSLLLSCSKESPVNPYDRKSEISIEESDILFGEEGGEGCISVNCAKDYTVECNSDWVTCTKEGLTVRVKANGNNSILGRTATIVLRCGQDSVKAVAQQTAFEFRRAIPEEISWDDSAGEMKYEYRAPYNVTIDNSSDWCKAEMVGDELKVSFGENTSGVARMNTIYLRGPKATDPVDSIYVSQYDFENKIAGLYTFQYYAKELDEEIWEYVEVLKTEDATITRDPETKAVYLNVECGFSVPMKFDPKRMVLSINGAQYVGVEKSGKSTFYIYTTMVDTKIGVMIYGDVFGMDAPITTKDGKIYLKFVDNGVWTQYTEGYAADTFYLYRFTNTPPDYQYSAGSMASYKYPVLTRKY